MLIGIKEIKKHNFDRGVDFLRTSVHCDNVNFVLLIVVETFEVVPPGSVAFLALTEEKCHGSCCCLKVHKTLYTS